MKRTVATMLMFLFAALSVTLAQQHEHAINLFVTKVDLSGEVHLAWTRNAAATGNVQYQLYRKQGADSAALVVSTTDTSYVDKIPIGISDLSVLYSYVVIGIRSGTADTSNIVTLPIAGLPEMGSFRLSGKIDSGKVKLQWDAPPVNTPVSYYLVFMGTPWDEKVFRKPVDSTTNLWSVIDIPAPSTFAQYDDVEFNFLVIAKLESGEILNSTNLQLTYSARERHDEVKFVTHPPLTGQINVPYTYNAKAISSDSSAVIRYRAEMHPMTILNVVSPFLIDSVSGAFSFTPVSGRGLYSIVIVASSSMGGSAKQEFTVTVGGGNGVIQGKITDTLDAGIKDVIVRAYKIVETLVAVDNPISFVYSTTTDANGNYRLPQIEPGTYKLRAIAPSEKYESQWYDGVHDVNHATIVSVLDSSVTIANFKLRGGPYNLPRVTVSGSVTDTSGLSLYSDSSTVFFARAEFALNFGGGLNIAADDFRRYFDDHRMHDFRLDGNSDFVFKAKTDTSGHYSIPLIPGIYIAFAKAKGYSVEFFNGKDNLLAADVIVVSADTNGINFTLAPLPPVVLGEIKGSVLDSVENIGIPARVIAFRDGWRFEERYHVARVYVTDADSTGAYDFSELLPGTYIVMAVPLGDYSPAFYTDDTSGIRWKRATKIAVNGNSIDNINIYVRRFGPFANGFTRIRGTVSIGDNYTAYGSFNSGTIVYATRGRYIAGYAITDASGNYSIEGLSPGPYSVVADKPGFNETAAASAAIGYTSGGNPQDATVNFSITSVTSVETPTVASTVPSAYHLEQNYPNPFNPTTTINYSLPQSGVVTLKVYNIIGQEVGSLVNGYRNAGTYSVTFDAQRLSSGVYFYRLQAGNFSTVKKMLLMK